MYICFSGDCEVGAVGGFGSGVSFVYGVLGRWCHLAKRVDKCAKVSCEFVSCGRLLV